MASIDTSIYNQGSQLDIGGSLERGMRLGDMIRKRRQDNEIKDIMKSGMTQNPDGSMSYDMKKPMSALMDKGYFQEALDLQDKQSAQQAAQAKMQKEKQERELEEITRAAWSITDQNTYSNALKSLSSKGIDVSQMPQEYNPQMVEHYKRQTLSTKERLDELEKQARLKLDQDRLEIERGKVKNAKQSGENLPIDSKKVIETLATKNASKISIKNQIDAVMSNWDNLQEDQKIAAGRQLLKTLNSTEGADAIGAEEANRLGSKLEYALGNFTNSNPTQFGRDLEGFKQQALNTSKGIGDAIEANKRQIDSAYGRPSAPETKKSQTVAQTKAPVFKTSEIEWK